MEAVAYHLLNTRRSASAICAAEAPSGQGLPSLDVSPGRSGPLIFAAG
jgi:hypothetical protein